MKANKDESEDNGGGPNFSFPEAATIRDYVETVDAHNERMKSKRGEYMAFCKAEREKIATVYDLAKDNGLPKRSLRAAIKRRDLRNKLENERESLDDLALQEDLDAIEKALASFEATPLGAAAAKKNKAV